MPSFEQLKVLIAAAETGNISAAARRLGETQPAVSKKFAALEERLGVCLAQRSPHHFVLTDAGQRLYDRARHLVQEFDLALEEAASDRVALSGSIRVTAPEAFGALHVGPALLEFQVEHPEIELELLLTNRVLDLLSENVDIAIRAAELADSNVVRRKIADFDFVIVASPHYLERAPPIAHPHDLASLHFISYGNRAADFVINFSIDGRATPVNIRPRTATNSAFTIRSAVLEGVGATMTARWFVQDLIDSGQVVQLFPEQAFETSTFYLVHPYARHTPRRIRGAIDHILPRLQRLPGLR